MLFVAAAYAKISALLTEATVEDGETDAVSETIAESESDET